MNQKISLIYPAKIVKENDGYTVTFRDLANLFSEGDTYEQALTNAQEVLDILLLEMVKNDLTIPEPSICHTDEIPIAVSPEIAAPVLLHQLRQERNYTMAEVAKTMGVSYQAYQKLETSKNITLKTLKKAAAALGATVEIKLHTHNKPA